MPKNASNWHIQNHRTNLKKNSYLMCMNISRDERESGEIECRTKRMIEKEARKSCYSFLSAFRLFEWCTCSNITILEPWEWNFQSLYFFPHFLFTIFCLYYTLYGLLLSDALLKWIVFFLSFSCHSTLSFVVSHIACSFSTFNLTTYIKTVTHK